jgi:hypothetical protein
MSISAWPRPSEKSARASLTPLTPPCRSASGSRPRHRASLKPSGSTDPRRCPHRRGDLSHRGRHTRPLRSRLCKTQLARLRQWRIPPGPR